MVTKEVDEEMDNCYEDMMDEVLEESMGEGVDNMDKEAAPDLGDGRPSVIYFKQADGEIKNNVATVIMNVLCRVL